MTRRKQALTSAGLSFLFLIVYGGTNWITGHRSDVGTLYFAWERFIPFMPIMIIPYMSIDAFFVAAPFLCESDEDLKLFARRITMAILMAGACFLLVPLRFAFPRPVVTGWLAYPFNFLHGFDQPFNMIPSLHITLRSLLSDIYDRHTRGIGKIIIRIWFSLIGLSTVLTFQHHVPDLIGGFILAALCFYFIRAPNQHRETTPNFRISGYYGAACVLSTWMALRTMPWGILLFWPAFSFGIAACAYAGAGPSVYRKEIGGFPFSSRLVLAPLFFGQQLSLLYYKRQCHPWDEIVPGVWVGRKLSSSEASGLSPSVTAVLDLTCEFAEAGPFLRKTYLNIGILDLTAPTQEQMRAAVQFIEAHSRRGIVFVHCKIGYSRSAAIVGAYLLKSKRAKTVSEAIAHMRAARPSLIVRPEAESALNTFAQLNVPGEEHR